MWLHSIQLVLKYINDSSPQPFSTRAIRIQQRSSNSIDIVKVRAKIHFGSVVTLGFTLATCTSDNN